MRKIAGVLNIACAMACKLYEIIWNFNQHDCQESNHWQTYPMLRHRGRAMDKRACSGSHTPFNLRATHYHFLIFLTKLTKFTIQNSPLCISLSICFCLHTKYVLFSPTFETEFPFISAAIFDAIEIWNYQFWQDTAAPRPHLCPVTYKARTFRLTMIWLRVRLRDILHFWRRLFTIMIQQLVPPILQISNNTVLINPSPPRGSPLMSKIVWR